MSLHREQAGSQHVKAGQTNISEAFRFLALDGVLRRFLGILKKRSSQFAYSDRHCDSKRLKIYLLSRSSANHTLEVMPDFMADRP